MIRPATADDLHAALLGPHRAAEAVLDRNVDAIAFYRATGAIGMTEWTVQRVSGDALGRLAGEG